MKYLVECELEDYSLPCDMVEAYLIASTFNRNTGLEAKVYKIVEVACYPARHNKDSNENSN